MHFKTATIVALVASLGGNLFTSAAPVADVAVPEASTTDVEIHEILAVNTTVSLDKRDGGFFGSCDVVRLGNPTSTLIADCRDLSGNWRTSTLNLNRCFANLNGNLAYVQHGNYGNSCDVRGSYLDVNRNYAIRCQGNNGVYGPLKAYPINPYITNASGQLMCFGGST
ncbi:uncharacterized protein B0I36DRAFT_357733 [Microdochium trichocladiopsis]|uniref:Cyanovirin-N domain-containing protein n=1 Tax=Microdochium trichocladiopsis TaxID=1682393 RepID=A0A9P8YH56_9PEZI|nr:uncharacterized protein B0I36DRAFT_357733 [Microdochium trichocladiopsis]KAH7040431.1 hypothetical protein B0I36DRAFT_357733 [Microdochium trichocladiopsis]